MSTPDTFCVPYFIGVGELIVLTVELDAADGANPVGLLQRRHQLVRIRRSGPLNRVGKVVDFVIAIEAGVGRRVAIALGIGLDERDGFGVIATPGAAADAVITPSAAPLVSFQNVLVVACELWPTIGIGTC